MVKPKQPAVRRVRETFKTGVCIGLLSDKPYINMPDGRGRFLGKFYLNFEAEENELVRVTVERIERSKGGKRGKAK